MVTKSHMAFKITSRISKFEKKSCKNLGAAQINCVCSLAQLLEHCISMKKKKVLLLILVSIHSIQILWKKWLISQDVQWVFTAMKYEFLPCNFQPKPKIFITFFLEKVNVKTSNNKVAIFEKALLVFFEQGFSGFSTQLTRTRILFKKSSKAMQHCNLIYTRKVLYLQF